MVMKMKKTFHLYTLLRISYSIIFLSSGILKLYFNRNFQESLESFEIIPENYITIVTIVVPVIELMIGGFIILNKWVKSIVKFSIYLLIFFTSILLLKIYEGSEINCSCFGPISGGNVDEISIVRNFLLIIFGCILFIWQKQKVITSNKFEISKLKEIFSYGVVIFLLTANILLATQNKMMKDSIDSLYYENIPISENDSIKSLKIYDLNLEEKNIEIKNETLLFIFKPTCKPCLKNYSNWLNITDEIVATKHRIDILGISLDDIKHTKSFIADNKSSFDVYWNDSNEFINSNKFHLTPLTILISTEGKVKYLIKGMVTNTNKNELLRKIL